MSNLNLNKYADQQAYNNDTRPAGESAVSLVGSDVVYDGVNVILKLNQLRRDDVCLVFWDTVNLEYVFVPVETYDASTFDTTRYTLQNFVRFTRSMGRDVVIHKDALSSAMWAEFNRYKLSCTTAADGGFTWSVVINGTTKGGTVTWTTGATLDSIVSQMNTQGAVSTYLVFSHESGENFIRIRKGGYSYSVFTISNVTGATLTDLSLNTKVGGVAQTQEHRDWQTQDTASLFPVSGFLPANSVQYARNGYNLSWMCGGNLARYKAYYGASGSSTYIAESTVGARMTQACFNSLNNDGNAEHQALYDKYGGSWDAYMAASMIQIDEQHANGIEYQSYNDGDKQTQFLASVTTEDFDGSYIPAYPIAYAAAQKTDTRGVLTFNLPTEHEMAVFMEDSVYAKINAAMSVLSGTALSNIEYYWSVARYGSYTSWLYGGTDGILNYNSLYGSCSGRALAYLN